MFVDSLTVQNGKNFSWEAKKGKIKVVVVLVLRECVG